MVWRASSCRWCLTLIWSDVKTILITGGSGFFGWNALRYFQQRGDTVIAGAPQPERYGDYFDVVPFQRLDVLDQQEVVEMVMQCKPDYIIHAAAYSTPSACERNPVRAQEINVMGTGNVFGAAAAMRIPLVFLSTDLVFDGDRGGYRESDETRPLTTYGRSKLQAERTLQGQSMFNRWAILRSSLMFGNGAEWTNAFPQFAENALCKGETVQLFVDQFRTPVFVDDVVRAIDTIVEHELFGEVFHCGGPERLNRVEFMRRYCSFMDIPQDGIREVTMDDVPDYPTRVRDVSLNSEKLRRATFWEPLAMEDAFEEMKTQRTSQGDD
jgi:dTDP-4-dehydrorhamnose reductase